MSSRSGCPRTTPRFSSGTTSSHGGTCPRPAFKFSTTRSWSLEVGQQLDRLADLHEVGGDRHLAPVDLEVAVGHHLAPLPARGREAQAEHHVVQPPLQELQEVLAGDAFLPLRPGEVLAELLLEDAVNPLGFLLLAELDAEGRELPPVEA